MEKKWFCYYSQMFFENVYTYMESGKENSTGELLEGKGKVYCVQVKPGQPKKALKYEAEHYIKYNLNHLEVYREVPANEIAEVIEIFKEKEGQ